MIISPRSFGIHRHLWKATATVILFVIFHILYLQFQIHKTASQATLAIDRPPTSEVAIPRRIWQIFFAPPNARLLDKTSIYSTQWVSMAPGYTYTMVSEIEAAAFVDDTFASSRPEIAAIYHALTNPALKSDLLRYLLLLERGGVYSDLDTKPVVLLEEWLPADRRRDTRLIIAPEYDESQDPHPRDFMHPVQFCQWTIAAAPGHPVLARMMDRVVASLRWVAEQQGTTLERAEISDFDVLNSTGPVAWTEVVMESLRERDESVKDFGDFFGVDKARYYGDIAVLPLESFRGDYLDDWGISWRRNRRSLVRHFFRGAWRQVALD